MLHIDSIGLYVCGAGGNGMRCRVSYSTNDDFSEAVSIAELTSSMVANTMYVVSAQPVLELSEGETLLLRIYPWYSSEATGKTICLSHVTLHGVAESVSSIQETNATDARLLQTIYYDICGVQLHSAPESGIYLEKNCYSDGRVSVLKKLK